MVNTINTILAAKGMCDSAGSISELLSTLYGNVKKNAVKSMTPSLTAYTKQTNIMSRLYIEDSILRDDICVPLVGVLNQLYVSYILCALNIDARCVDGRTVREIMEVVGTENYNLVKEILDNFGSSKYNYSNENSVIDMEPATQRLPVGRLIELSLTGVQVLKDVTEKTVTYGGVNQEVGNTNRNGWGTNIEGSHSSTDNGMDEDGNPRASETNGSRTTTSTTGSDDHSEKTTMHGGQDVERGETARATTYQFKAYLYVQLIPYVLKEDVVGGYISANFNPPISNRWTKFRAGEISFWNDFVFARDLVKKQEQILKNDKSGVITEMMTKNRSKLARWFMNLIGLGRTVSHNLANTIMICNKATFTKACRDSSINFENYDQRQRFFNKTWSMIICVVDPMYNTVEMYFNGVDAKGTYTYDMMNKVGAKGKDSFDLKEIMSAFSQGLSPKF